MNPVIHFEMPYDDRDRMADFYEKAFGWQTNKLGKEMGNYVVAMTSERKDMNQFPDKPGVIDGGFFERTENNQHPSVVVSVPDIQAAMKKVEAAGGKIVGASKPSKEPDMIPGIGLYISIEDTEGNRVSLLQPMGM
jgi:hypothetical protein